MLFVHPHHRRNGIIISLFLQSEIIKNILSRTFYGGVIESKSIDHTEIAITRLHLIPSIKTFPPGDLFTYDDKQAP